MRTNKKLSTVFANEYNYTVDIEWSTCYNIHEGTDEHGYKF
jgi:hypothetical protein